MTAAPRRVLVVEDDPAIRRGVVAALSFAGYKVLEAADGPRGLSLAETAEVDLVLLDVVLPGTDGREIRHADGDRVELSEKEAELAAYLAANAGRTMSLRHVWATYAACVAIAVAGLAALTHRALEADRAEAAARRRTIAAAADREPVRFVLTLPLAADAFVARP